jgi:predicted DNA-binding transcriptional regulator AlpA
MPRLLSYDELAPKKGLRGSKPTVWRLEKQRKFPKRIALGPQRYAWPENVIDAYIAALVAGHSQAEATAIAEQLRKRIAETA